MNSQIEAQIRECETRLYAAMLASNVAELDILIADDLLFAGPNGELATKAQDLEMHRSGAVRFHEFVPRDLEIRVWNSEFALASARIFVRGLFQENEFAGEFRYTRVWRKGKSGWQIVGGSVCAMS